MKLLSCSNPLLKAHIFLITTCLAGTSLAATFTVTNLNDSGAGSLRAALALANSNPNDQDTINIAVTGLLKVTGGLQVLGPVDIVGPGIDKLTIEGDGLTSTFNAFRNGDSSTTGCSALTSTDFTWTLTGLALTKGRAHLADGGAVRTLTSFKASQVAFLNNVAIGGSAIAANLRYPNQLLELDRAIVGQNISQPPLGNTTSTSYGAILVENRCFTENLTASVNLKGSLIAENVIDNSNTNGNAGAGMWIVARGANVSITDTVIADNRINIPAGATAGYFGGGGYFSVKSLSFDRSEISGNSARSNAALYILGATQALQSLSDRQTVTISNTTVSGNKAQTNGGGTVYVVGNASLTLQHATLADNTSDGVSNATVLLTTATYTSGSPTQSAIPSLTVDSSIIVRSPGDTRTTYRGIAGPLSVVAISATNSYLDSVSTSLTVTGTGNILSGDPMLLPLADNTSGGLGNGSFTHAPAPGSPLIGKGSATSAPFDQRGTGFPRTQAGKTDIGAHQTKALLTAVEFYHPTLNHYFMTSSPSEATGIDNGAAGAGWARTGKTWKTWELGEAGSSAVCRFYAFTANSHFYTASPSECSSVEALNPTKLPAKGWIREEDAFNVVQPILVSGQPACASGFKPLYRVYNRAFLIPGKTDSNHRYTTDTAVVSAMVSQGWVSEGVVMCVQ